MRAELPKPFHEDQEVLPVLRVRRRPRRGQVRAPHLVQRDPRGRARGRRGGAVEDPVRPVRHLVRVHRVRRSADPLLEVHLPVDGLRAEGAQLGRIDEVGGGRDDSGSGELGPERDGAVGEVDPDRSLVRDPALA